jgi:3-phenylpropionate/trans-cinnamate dioxygenase ferredoxin component
MHVRTMADYLELGTIHEMRDGSLKKVSAAGREILLARSGNRYYCTDNLCPHLEGDLSQGILHGSVITCPMHHSQFDLNDGHVIRWTDLTGIRLVLAKNVRPPRPLVMYPVKIESEKIFAAIPPVPGEQK